MRIVDVTKLVLFNESHLDNFSFEDEDNHVPTFVDTIGFECVRTF